MIRNIAVAEANQNLLCQDTGIPIYNVTIGSGVEVDGYELKQAIVKGCERATTGASAALLGRASGDAQEPAHVERPAGAGDQHRFRRRCARRLSIEMIPEGLGLGEQLVAQDGDSRRRRRRDQDVRHRLRARRGRQDVSADDRRRRRRRHRRPVRASVESRGDAPAGQPRATTRKARSSKRSSRGR